MLNSEIGAQRLSASKIVSRARICHLSGSHTCSTPFGIQDRFTAFRMDGAYGGCVLNAFRHPRSFHFKHFRAFHGIDPVLNAFRHPRSFHTKNCQKSDRKCQCSTPFGIQDRFTSLGGCKNEKNIVLNAFRHPRSFHASSVKKS